MIMRYINSRFTYLLTYFLIAELFPPPEDAGYVFTSV